MRPRQWTDLETFLLSSRDLAPTTTHKTLLTLRRLERAGVDPIRPSRKKYDAFMAQRKRDGKSGPGDQHYGRAILHALRWKKIPRWPDFRVSAPASSKRELLADHVVAQLLEYDQGRDELETAHARFGMNLGFYACLRPSEHVAIELDDFDPIARTLRIWSDKLDTGETIDLAGFEAQLIADYIAGPRAAIARAGERALVVHPYTGRAHVSTHAYRLWLTRCGKRVDKRFSAGQLRGAGATRLFLQTRDIYLTKARLRHSRLSSTEVYVRIASALQARRLLQANLGPYKRGELA